MADDERMWECPQCGGKLDVSSLGFFAEVICPSCGQVEHVHTRLANFELIRILGVGGMSVVFEARDIILNRRIAIKLLNDAYRDSPERIARFEGECAMMARVRHENVVSVFSAGWAHNQFYIAMELIDGHDLEREVRKGEPLEPVRALNITRQVVQGLQAANKAGLLHRDMKPGNILLPTGNDDAAKVLDFGLSLGNKSKDKEEVIWATPYYVAPETLYREEEDVRTDIYALGMTLRFLLTGKDDLPGYSDTLESLLEAKKKLEPFANLLPGSHPSLCDLVDHMCAFVPQDRPFNYNELLLEIDEVLAILKEQAEAHSPRRVRMRLMAWGGGVLTTLLMGFLGMQLTTHLTTPPPVQKILRPTEFDDWGDLEVLDVVLRDIEKQDWDSVNRNLGRLNNENVEPTLAAFSAVVQLYMALQGTDGQIAEKVRADYRKHMERGGNQHSSAAHEYFQDLQLLSAILESNYPVEQKPLPRTPFLQGVVQAGLTRHITRQEGVEAGKRKAEEAKQTILQEPGALRSLASLLDSMPFETLARNTEAPSAPQAPRHADNPFDNLLDALKVQDFVKADKLFAELRNRPGQSGLQSNRLLVLQQVRQAAEPAVACLKKKFGDQYEGARKEGENPFIAMRAVRIASGHGGDNLAYQFYTMGLMLECDFDAAFTEWESFYKNVYSGKDSEHVEDFNVLVQYWKGLLEPEAVDSSVEQIWAENDNFPKTDVERRFANAVMRNDPDGCRIAMRQGVRPNMDWLLKDNLRRSYLGSVGKTELLRALLDGGLDPNKVVGIRGVIHQTASVESAALLVERGAKVDLESLQGLTPLSHVPVADVAEFLISKGANVNHANKSGTTPLHVNYASDVIDVLLKHGANPNMQAKDGFTPLMCSARGNFDAYLRTAKLLVANGADPNVRNKDGDTALHLNMKRCLKDHAYQIAQVLMGAGADPSITNNEGETPLSIATKRYGANSPVVNVLKNKNDSGSAADSEAVAQMLKAVKDDDLSRFRSLVQSASPGQINNLFFNDAEAQRLLTSEKKFAFLRILVENGLARIDRQIYVPLLENATNPELVTLLKSHDYDLSACNNRYGFNALYGVKNAKVAEALINNGLSLDYKAPGGELPIQVNPYPEVVKFYIKKGSDVHAKTNDKYTVLHSHRRRLSNYVQCAKLFIDKQVDVNAETKKGDTPLHFVVSEESHFGPDCAEACEVLVKAGANVNAKNKAGKTPLDISIENHGPNAACSQYLKRNGGRRG